MDATLGILFYYFIALLLIILIPKVETIDIISEHQNHYP